VTLTEAIFAGALALGVVILIVDRQQVRALENQCKDETVDVLCWEKEYSEASEDRRQYTNLTWQLPSAILVADGIAISFAYSYDVRVSAPWWAPALLLLAAFVFDIIMYLNFWKFAYRSYSRLLRLRKIEDKMGMKRVGGREPIPIRWGTWKWMSFLILLLSAGLLDLALQLIH
jgi:hypothetical protein